MKILWQAYDRADYTGGPIINTIRLLPEFKKIGHEIITIIGHNGTGYPNAEKLRENNINCLTYRIPKYSEDHTKIFLEALIQNKPDIFVSNISVQAGFAGRWAQHWGIPVIHTHRSNDALNCGTAEFFFAGPPEWRLNALVCVNNYLLDQIKAVNSKGYISRMIPSGVPIPILTNDKIKYNELKIVYSGRIIQEQKRINDLLSSFISIARIMNNVSLTLIGTGEAYYVKRLKAKVIEAGMSNRIRFVGRLLEDDYKNELMKHHIIVLLSDYEGIPGAVMDGMSCGLVPIVLNVNGIDELVKHRENGLIIQNREKAFQEAIRELLENIDLYKRLSNNARNTIRNNFSLEKTVLQWHELFKEVISTSDIKKPMIMPDRINLPKENHLLIQHRSKLSFRKLMYKYKRLFNALR